MGPGPDATWFIETVANQGVGTAAGDHSGRLIGQVLGGVDHLILQRDLVPHVFAVPDLSDLPSTEGHSTSKLHPQFTGSEGGLPVTGVTGVRDKTPRFLTKKARFLVRDSCSITKAVTTSGGGRRCPRGQPDRPRPQGPVRKR